jgi:hypothetical protein
MFASGKKVVSAGFASKFRVHRTANQSIPATTWTKVQFNVETGEGYDNNNEVDTVTNYRFTASKAGWYHYDAIIRWFTGSNNHYIDVRKNGSNNISYGERDFVSGEGVSVASGDIYLAVNDYLEVWVYTSAAMNIYAGVGSCYFNGHRFG